MDMDQENFYLGEYANNCRDRMVHVGCWSTPFQNELGFDIHFEQAWLISKHFDIHFDIHLGFEAEWCRQCLLGNYTQKDNWRWFSTRLRKIGSVKNIRFQVGFSFISYIYIYVYIICILHISYSYNDLLQSNIEYISWNIFHISWWFSVAILTIVIQPNIYHIHPYHYIYICPKQGPFSWTMCLYDIHLHAKPRVLITINTSYTYIIPINVPGYLPILYQY